MGRSFCQVAKQNEAHLEQLRLNKLQEASKVRMLEAEWAELLNQQERQRERQLKQTYARQAKQCAASSARADVVAARAAEDEVASTRPRPPTPLTKLLSPDHPYS